MRKIKTSAVLKNGFVSGKMGTKDLKSAPVIAWTQAYHKPYALDWGEARRKALNRHFGKEDIVSVEIKPEKTY